MSFDLGRVTPYGLTLNSRSKRTAPGAMVATLAEFEKTAKVQVDAARARRAELLAEVKQIKADAKTLTGPARQAKLAEATRLTDQANTIIEKAEGLASYDVVCVAGSKGRDLVYRDEAHLDLDRGEKPFDYADAGHAVVASTNATLWRVGFGYGTHKSMEAWLQDVPASGKVELSVICSPSAHAGSDEKSMEASYESFARTNRYVAEVWHKSQSGQMRLVKSESFGIKKAPEYASISPTITIDVNALKGDIIVRGWAEGSAGYAGYIEARETVIHNP